MVKLGDRAIWIPRVPYGRQHELLAFVTRVVDAENDIADLVVFPANGELLHINAAVRKRDGIHIHCWEPLDGSDKSQHRAGQAQLTLQTSQKKAAG